MASNILKRRRSRLLKDNKFSANPFFSSDDLDLDEDEPPTKIKLKTNDVAKYLSTSDNYMNDLLQQIDRLKQQIHRFEDAAAKEASDHNPILSIKYRDQTIADKFHPDLMKILTDLVGNDIKYKLRYENCSIDLFEEAISVETDVHSTPNDVQVDNNVELEQNTFDDSLICLDTSPAADNNTSDIQYQLLSTETPPKKAPSRNNNFGCFNCGDQSGHQLKDCPKPKNWERINQARKNMREQTNTSGNRYHISSDSDKFAMIAPGGDLSKGLRRALGLHSDEIPLHVYKMRILGYPPGWYEELVTEGMRNKDAASSTLSVFTDSVGGSAVEDTPTNTVVKESMIVEYPGFNVPLKQKMKDEHWKYKVPPYQDYQNKNNFIIFLNQYKFNNSSSLNMSPMGGHPVHDIIDITETTDTETEEINDVEMEIVPNSDEPLLVEKPPPACQKERQEQPTTSNGSTCPADNPDPLPSTSKCVPVESNGVKAIASSPIATEARTPVLTKISSYTSLPDLDKFSKDMGPLINFENLADSVGTYDRMKGLLNKVRTKLKSIHSSNTS